MEDVDERNDPYSKDELFVHMHTFVVVQLPLQHVAVA
jgi:hypothetical protein